MIDFYQLNLNVTTHHLKGAFTLYNAVAHIITGHFLSKIREISYGAIQPNTFCKLEKRIVSGRAWLGIRRRPH